MIHAHNLSVKFPIIQFGPKQILVRGSLRILCDASISISTFLTVGGELSMLFLRKFLPDTRQSSPEVGNPLTTQSCESNDLDGLAIILLHFIEGWKKEDQHERYTHE